MLPVTAFFAAILGIIYVGLSFFVIKGRIKYRLAIGDGGNHAMQRRIRAHANFAEYVPFCLLLLAVNELRQAPHGALFLMGTLLVAGRLSHAYGLTVAEMQGLKLIFRQAGMISTFTVLLVLSVMLLVG